jgi:hypothetical protein
MRTHKPDRTMRYNSVTASRVVQLRMSNRQSFSPAKARKFSRLGEFQWSLLPNAGNFDG